MKGGGWVVARVQGMGVQVAVGALHCATQTLKKGQTMISIACLPRACGPSAAPSVASFCVLVPPFPSGSTTFTTMGQAVVLTKRRKLG